MLGGLLVFQYLSAPTCLGRVQWDTVHLLVCNSCAGAGMAERKGKCLEIQVVLVLGNAQSRKIHGKPFMGDQGSMVLQRDVFAPWRSDWHRLSLGGAGKSPLPTLVGLAPLQVP